MHLVEALRNAEEVRLALEALELVGVVVEETVRAALDLVGALDAGPGLGGGVEDVGEAGVADGGLLGAESVDFVKASLARVTDDFSGGGARAGRAAVGAGSAALVGVDDFSGAALFFVLEDDSLFDIVLSRDGLETEGEGNRLVG